MENNNPKDTAPEADAVDTTAPSPEPTPEPKEDKAPEETPDSSSKTEDKEDLTPLIEEEKKRGPDPEKAKERIIKKRQQEDPQDDDDLDEEDRPMTRAEVQELLNRNTHDTILASQKTEIQNTSEDIAETPEEAELIRTIHANRVYPVGMSIREQMQEAQAVATIQRERAKNGELARKIQSQNNVSRNTATSHRDPQAPLEPDLAPDLKDSMKRSGYTYNSSNKRYEKKLPNGKILLKEKDKAPYLAEG